MVSWIELLGIPLDGLGPYECGRLSLPSTQAQEAKEVKHDTSYKKF